MTQKHRVQVVIGGKVLTMGGLDDEVMIQRMAAHVNKKIQELEGTDAYRCLPTDLKPILIELNIAEDYMRAKEQIAQLEEDLRMKENELSQLKQELVETQVKLERIEGKKRR